MPTWFYWGICILNKSKRTRDLLRQAVQAVEQIYSPLNVTVSHIYVHTAGVPCVKKTRRTAAMCETFRCTLNVSGIACLNGKVHCCLLSLLVCVSLITSWRHQVIISCMSCCEGSCWPVIVDWQKKNVSVLFRKICSQGWLTADLQQKSETQVISAASW